MASTAVAAFEVGAGLVEVVAVFGVEAVVVFAAASQEGVDLGAVVVLAAVRIEAQRRRPAWARAFMEDQVVGIALGTAAQDMEAHARLAQLVQTA